MQTREPFWLSATAGEFAYVAPVKEEKENRVKSGETRGREEERRGGGCCPLLMLPFEAVWQLVGVEKRKMGHQGERIGEGREGGGSRGEKEKVRRGDGDKGGRRKNVGREGRATWREKGGGERSVAASDGGVFAGAHREGGRRLSLSFFWRREGEKREQILGLVILID